ncbi:hypothetical protein GUITHDRAFT_151916 [Guillardia theta CCMP2712]|uniref:Uncharacterized protein n=2 Tax=Guillardia theta TaxID=55529 RepID=L1JIY4_GUITC|nr:hypothetical protein GUITHDRAFT_151916 [Guillardia theta CCMP2712]EKX48055.1 hypothetical protein GUITHDRAFT_151916 [Guillardia theta CCMP2712]|eukprot:XP_005835035.1 hypothetical protein GUITHDRAFT_151916 [Guillardia theta CCMP2712]
MEAPTTPKFLLQIMRLLRRKETLIEQARAHNDSMQALRDGDTDMDGEKQARKNEKAHEIQKEYAWCIVQVDRTNFQLRNALWGVALGLYEGSEKNNLTAPLLPPAADSNHVGDKRHGANGTLQQCEQTASALFRGVVMSSESLDQENELSHGTQAAQPLIESCLAILLLLRKYEEYTAAMAAGTKSGDLQSKEQWDASFNALLNEIRPQSTCNDALFQDIVQNIETLKESINNE